MTKTYLALALLITVLACNAYGEDEVYYCADTDAIGFGYDKNLKKYGRTVFLASKFKMKLDRTAGTIELAMKGNAAEGIYNCLGSVGQTPELMICFKPFRTFNFNTSSGRYTSSGTFGYVAGNHDDIGVFYGTCDKF